MQAIEGFWIVRTQLVADHQAFFTQGLQGQLTVRFAGVFCHLFATLATGEFDDVVNASTITQALLASQEAIALDTIGECQDTDGTLLGDQPAVKPELLQHHLDFTQVDLAPRAVRRCQSSRNSSGHPLPGAVSRLAGACTALESPCMLSRAACNRSRRAWILPQAADGRRSYAYC